MIKQAYTLDFVACFQVSANRFRYKTANGNGAKRYRHVEEHDQRKNCNYTLLSLCILACFINPAKFGNSYNTTNYLAKLSQN